jgi:hypothetical protein
MEFISVCVDVILQVNLNLVVHLFANVLTANTS